MAEYSHESQRPSAIAAGVGPVGKFRGDPPDVAELMRRGGSVEPAAEGPAVPAEVAQVLRQAGLDPAAGRVDRGRR